jgi:hypothetical protein
MEDVVIGGGDVVAPPFSIILAYETEKFPKKKGAPHVKDSSPKHKCDFKNKNK